MHTLHYFIMIVNDYLKKNAQINNEVHLVDIYLQIYYKNCIGIIIENENINKKYYIKFCLFIV